eukprot:g1721.t1
MWGGPHTTFEFAPELPPAAVAAGELRVVWMNDNPHCFKQRGKRCVPLFERDFMYDWLFRDLNVRRKRMIMAGGCHTLAPRAAYVFNGVLSCGQEDVAALAKALKVCGSPGMLIHFGDENGTWSKELGYADWTLILRQYFNKRVEDFWGDKLVVVPLGYSANFWRDYKTGREWVAADPRGSPKPTARPCRAASDSSAKAEDIACDPPTTAEEARHFLPTPSQRTHTWAFFGDVKKSTRPDMARAMAKVKNGFSFQSHGFAGNDMRWPVELRSVQAQSVFCPAPTGWYNPDSYRYAESLEVGCFPLVDGHPSEGWRDFPQGMAHYWEDFYKYFKLLDTVQPFVKLVDKWADVPAHIEESLKDMRELDQRQVQMMDWWYAYKTELSKKIGRLVRARVLDTEAE